MSGQWHQDVLCPCCPSVHEEVHDLAVDAAAGDQDLVEHADTHSPLDEGVGVQVASLIGQIRQDLLGSLGRGGAALLVEETEEGTTITLHLALVAPELSRLPDDVHLLLAVSTLYLAEGAVGVQGLLGALAVEPHAEHRIRLILLVDVGMVDERTMLHDSFLEDCQFIRSRPAVRSGHSQLVLHCSDPVLVRLERAVPSSVERTAI